MLALPPSTSSTTSLLVDALPYLDTDYGERDREFALQMVEQECRVFPSTKNYLRHLPVPDYDAFLTPILLKEVVRMKKKEDMAKLDMARCELPVPARGTDNRQAWKKAIDNAKAQNEHLTVRHINLELMDEMASEGYLMRNRTMESLLADEENALRDIKEKTIKLHAKRKASQMEAGTRLKEGEAAWVSMLTKNYEMEMIIGDMKKQNEQRAKRLKQ